jgi:antiviral defense system Shedu protein SduA
VPGRIERLLREVNHVATSNSKYREFENYLGELLGISASSIYTVHVAKSGNFDVRMTQSKRGREARLRVAIVKRNADFDSVVNLSTRIAQEEYPGTAALVVSEVSGQWTPRWAIEPRTADENSPDDPYHLSWLHSWFDDFELRTYSYAPAQFAQARLNTLLTNFSEIESLLPDLPPTTLQASLVRAQVPQWLYSLDPRLFATFIENDVTANDVIAMAHRRAVVERFRRLLGDAQFFNEAAEEYGGRSEAVWQHLLEDNPWILGVSLAGQLLTSWNPEKLEQVVAGFSVGGPGKRADALMHTSGQIRALVFAEIKHHKTDLLDKEYRPGAWAPSAELSGGVAQVQQTIHLASREIGERLAETDESGAETGEFTYLVRPRSFLILGSLDKLRGSSGVHRAKYESFELYRRNLYEPEIITFDELLARAEWHVATLDLSCNCDDTFGVLVVIHVSAFLSFSPDEPHRHEKQYLRQHQIARNPQLKN